MFIIRLLSVFDRWWAARAHRRDERLFGPEVMVVRDAYDAFREGRLSKSAYDAVVAAHGYEARLARKAKRS